MGLERIAQVLQVRPGLAFEQGVGCLHDNFAVCATCKSPNNTLHVCCLVTAAISAYPACLTWMGLERGTDAAPVGMAQWA